MGEGMQDAYMAYSDQEYVYDEPMNHTHGNLWVSAVAGQGLRSPLRHTPEWGEGDWKQQKNMY